MNTLQNDIKNVLDETMSRIADAAGKHDVKALGLLTARATKLEEMKRTVIGIENALKEYQSLAATGDSSNNLRRLPIRVSEGMIRQNLLTFSEHIKRGRIQVEEEMNIEVQSTGARFSSKVLQNGNRLQERGEIGRFYRAAGVHDGDVVMLTETKPNEWTLEKPAPSQASEPPMAG